MALLEKAVECRWSVRELEAELAKRRVVRRDVEVVTEEEGELEGDALLGVHVNSLPNEVEVVEALGRETPTEEFRDVRHHEVTPLPIGDVEERLNALVRAARAFCDEYGPEGARRLREAMELVLEGYLKPRLADVAPGQVVQHGVKN